jgi:hypothetical protein
MRWSSPSWWQEPLRVDLAEIMDDLDDGWAGWTPARRKPDPAPVG